MEIGPSKPHPHRYGQPTDIHELRRVDEALAIVQGHYVYAAKLLDMDTQRLRNLVNGHPWLREKWGRGKPGKPKGYPRLWVQEYDAAHERLARSEVAFISSVIERMKPEHRVAIAAWLNRHLAASGLATGASPAS